MLESMKRNKVYVIIGSILVVFFIVTVCLVGFRDSPKQPYETAGSSPADFSQITPEVTEEPTQEPSPALNPTLLPTPIAPDVISGLSTKGKEWSFGHRAHKKDENGIEQMIYELEAEDVAVTSKYNAITGHKGGKKVYLTFD